MSKSDEYLWDRSGDVDPDVARLESLLSPLRHDAPLRKPPRRRAPWIAGGVLLAAAAAAIAVWQWPRTGACAGAGFAFTGRGGAVACNGESIASGALPVGGTLDTGEHEAELAIADIGTAQLGVATRVRLDRSAATGHQLYLERGSLHARVNAPPRLFEVATPSAQVTDLGCEYTLEVAADGAGQVSVQSGKIELATPRGVVVAPAGTHAAIYAGKQPGLPVVDGASPAFAAAVAAFEHDVIPSAWNGGSASELLARATEADAITVANLAVLAPEPAILARLAELFPVPPDQRDPVAWRDAVVAVQLTVHGLLGR